MTSHIGAVASPCKVGYVLTPAVVGFTGLKTCTIHTIPATFRKYDRLCQFFLCDEMRVTYGDIKVQTCSNNWGIVQRNMHQELEIDLHT